MRSGARAVGLGSVGIAVAIPFAAACGLGGIGTLALYDAGEATDAPGVDGAVGDVASGSDGSAAAPCALNGGGAGAMCNGTCVDVVDDHDHCGGCSPCSVSATCENGACVEVAAALVGFRYEQPCTNGQRPFCPTTGASSRVAILSGTPGKTYQIGVHVRGVVEQKTIVLSKPSGATGTNAAFLVTGGSPAVDAWNTFSLKITSPSLELFLNAGASGHSYSDALDCHTTFLAAAGASLTLACDPVDGLESPNEDSSGKQIVVLGVPPAPNAFDGEFVQIDVEAVRPTP